MSERVNANHDDDIIQVHVASGERVEFTKEMVEELLK